MLDESEELMLLNCDVGVLEKTLESPLDCKEIQPVHSEGDQPWDFFGRNDAKAEAPVLWPPDAKKWLIGKDSNSGKDWRQEEKGTTEDEIVGWHPRLNGYEFEHALGAGDGQGSLVCCSPQGHKESGHDWIFWTGLHPTRLLCPWDFPGKNTGVGCHFLLQGIFSTQGSNPCHLHQQVYSLLLSYQGSPINTFMKFKKKNTRDI